MTTTTHIVTALNKAWDAIRKNHPEVPSVMLTTGRRRHKSEAATRGSHCADQWHVDGHESRQAEVWISGERLSEGAVAVMQTLLHEAAHALAGARNIKDTSNRNRYHNQEFVKLAEELGLEGPGESAGPTRGYTDCHITDSTVKAYDRHIQKLDEACKSFVAPSMNGDEKKPKKVQPKAMCQCPEGENEINWTKALQAKQDARGLPPLLCGICRQAFIPEEDGEAA